MSDRLRVGLRSSLQPTAAMDSEEILEIGFSKLEISHASRVLIVLSSAILCGGEILFQGLAALLFSIFRRKLCSSITVTSGVFTGGLPVAVLGGL